MILLLVVLLSVDSLSCTARLLSLEAPRQVVHARDRLMVLDAGQVRMLTFSAPQGEESATPWGADIGRVVVGPGNSLFVRYEDDGRIEERVFPGFRLRRSVTDPTMVDMARGPGGDLLLLDPEGAVWRWDRSGALLPYLRVPYWEAPPRWFFAFPDGLVFIQGKAALQYAHATGTWRRVTLPEAPVEGAVASDGSPVFVLPRGLFYHGAMVWPDVKGSLRDATFFWGFWWILTDEGLYRCSGIDS